MEKKIGKIIIKYSAKECDKMVEVTDIIEKNQTIFNSLVNEYTIDLSKGMKRFDKVFKYLVQNVYGNNRLNIITDDLGSLSSVYLEALIRKNNIKNPNVIDRNPSVSDEDLSTVLAYAYFDRTSNFDKFTEYIKHRYSEEPIMDWAKELLRDYLYQYVIDEICDSLNTINVDYIDQMEYILDEVQKGNVIDLNSIFNRIQTKVEYPSLTDSEFDKMVYEFLSYVDAPKEWVDKYEYLKRKNYITNKESEIDESACYYNRETDEFEILICNKNNINGFCSFIHEFVHYVILENRLSLRHIMVSEFPSIYFEVKAADFLKEKGYDTKIVDAIVFNRKMSNYGICITMGEFFEDIIAYNQGKIISVEKKFNKYKEQYERFERVKKIVMAELGPEKEDFLKNLPTFNDNYEQEIKDNIDKSIMTYLKKGFEMIQGYQYLLDTYLVNQIIETKDEEETKKIYNITSDLANYDVEDILSEFGIYNGFGLSLELD